MERTPTYGGALEYLRSVMKGMQSMAAGIEDIARPLLQTCMRDGEVAEYLTLERLAALNARFITPARPHHPLRHASPLPEEPGCLPSLHSDEEAAEAESTCQ